MTREFVMTRSGTNLQYNVELFDEREVKDRYAVVVKSVADPNDRDKITLQPISEFMDEMIAYLKKNLRIYPKEDGTIDYLSLANDASIFTA